MKEVLAAISAVRPSLLECNITKEGESGHCGFHLSRTQWDPYPWISMVDKQSPAESAGLSIGDFVIEVNGEDVLGLGIEQIALKVRKNLDSVRLLIWKSPVSETENKLAAVFNLHKFCRFLQSAMQLMECPVCCEVASSPTFQCINGHIICGSCRARTGKCPLCRVPLSGKGRCLVVEKLSMLMKQTLCSGPS